jgi:hypothetical protein
VDITLTFYLAYTDDNLRLIGVLVYHPEYLLRVYDQVHSRTADLAINLAAALVAKESTIDATFLERRALKIATAENLRSRNLVFSFEGNALTTVMKALAFEGNGGTSFTTTSMPASIISWLRRETNLEDLAAMETTVNTAYQAARAMSARRLYSKRFIG